MKQIVVDNFSTDYYITEEGKCWSAKTNKFLKGQINSKSGYLTYHIKLPNGKMKRISAHRTVALNFIPNPLNKPEVNHKDGNKLNNFSSNLEWVTSKENKEHAIENGLRTVRSVYCFSKEKVLVATYKTAREASNAVGISIGSLYQELPKEPKSLLGGFYWSYENKLGATKDYTANGKAKPVNQYTKDGCYITTYPSTGIAAKAIGAKKGTHIGECCRGRIKSYKNFVWRYVEDIVSPLSESQRTPQEL